MIDGEFSHQVENPLIWKFVRDNCGEFVKDVKVFSEEILANLPSDIRPFVISAGLTFYSMPIASLVTNFPWERIEEAIMSSVGGIFGIEDDEQGQPQKTIGNDLKGTAGKTQLIEQAILASFVSINTSEKEVVRAVIVGGMANLLGKYVALTIAATLDETIRGNLPPVLQIQAAPAPDSQPIK